MNAVPPADSRLLLQRNAKNVTPLHATCSLSSPLAAAVVKQVQPRSATSHACHPPTPSFLSSHILHVLSACAVRSCCPTALSQTDSNGASPLHVAAHCGNAAAIDLLLSCATEHDMPQLAAATESSGHSALWLAAAAGHAAAVQALLKVAPAHLCAAISFYTPSSPHASCPTGNAAPRRGGGAAGKRGAASAVARTTERALYVALLQQ